MRADILYDLIHILDYSIYICPRESYTVSSKISFRSGTAF